MANNVTNKKIEPHYLYLVKYSQLKLLTQADAARIAMLDDAEVVNMYEELGIPPDMIEVEYNA